jgi:hypothetical protein
VVVLVTERAELRPSERARLSSDWTGEGAERVLSVARLVWKQRSEYDDGWLGSVVRRRGNRSGTLEQPQTASTPARVSLSSSHTPLDPPRPPLVSEGSDEERFSFPSTRKGG